MTTLQSAKGRALYFRRRAANYLFIALSIAAALFGMVWLAFILGALLKNGITALSPTLLTQPTPAPGSPGGLSNAILGSVIMSLGAVVVGTPIGLFAGTYLAEYAPHSKLSFVVRFVNDILLSAPSIVTGLFVYELIVVPMGHFSAIAGAASLMVIVIPVVVRTTENMLLLVPGGLREAASCAGRTAELRHPVGDLESRPGRHRHRRPAVGGAHLGRNRALAVHRAEQPVHVHRHYRPDGFAAGGDLPVRPVAL